MATRTHEPEPFEPFGVGASMKEWCCLPKAARELMDIDRETIGTMTQADAAGLMVLSPDAGVRVVGIANLMRSLNLDPDSVRLRQPRVKSEFGAACLSSTEGSRCARGFWAGTAHEPYPRCCPQAARLDLSRHA